MLARCLSYSTKNRKTSTKLCCSKYYSDEVTRGDNNYVRQTQTQQLAFPVKYKKSRGFLDFRRVTAGYRDPLLRQNDWREINALHFSYDTNEEQIQAARCMDCGTPFCQTHTGCPVNNLIPEWSELVSAGQWRAASERLHRTNNFPEFTGRVCPAPCESACVAGLATDSVAIATDSVAIKRIELAIVERAWAEGWITPRVPARRSGLSVAVVGSGPAGLAAADCLNQRGHAVSVFERDKHIGGLLTYGIPSMKLDKEAVGRRVRLLASEGIRFLTGVDVGTAIDSRDLHANYDAVVVCIGAALPRDIRVPGRELGGVHFAMEFLAQSQQRLFFTSSGHLAPPNAPHSQSPASQEIIFGGILTEGRDVVVIGGGDTGTDCIGTAMRQRCRSITNIELMRRPPGTRGADNPWPQWPRVHRIDYGHAEARQHSVLAGGFDYLCEPYLFFSLVDPAQATARFGADPRAYGLAVKEFLGTEEGRVRAVVTQSVDWAAPRGAEGQLPTVAGTEKMWPADVVLLAMGFASPQHSPLVKQLAVPLDERGNFRAGWGDFSAGTDGVFAAGDCRRGQSLVVWAIKEGRRAAECCHAYLLQKQGHAENFG